MSLGFVKAGFDVIGALEWDPAAIQTYLVNLGAYPIEMVFIEESDRERMDKYLQNQIKKVMAKPAWDQRDVSRCAGLMSGSNRRRVAPDFDGVQFMFVGDARKISGKRMLEIMQLEPGEVDCVMGGPPCQGFSTSNNKRNVMDPRNSLVFEFARIVLDISPKTMIMENVPGILDMVTPEGIPVMDAFCKILSDGGFGAFDALKKSLLSSSGCGAALRGQQGTRKGLSEQKRRVEQKRRRKKEAQLDLL